MPEGMSRNADKLLKGLTERGVRFQSPMTCYIQQNRGQGMMNKAAGEAAPTWELMQDGLFYLGRLYQSGHHPVVEFEGEVLTGVCSHFPLGWIVRHQPSVWELSSYIGRLEVHVPDLPPQWT